MKGVSLVLKSRYIDWGFFTAAGLLAVSLVVLLAVGDGCDYYESPLFGALEALNVVMVLAAASSLVLHVAKNLVIRRYKRLLVDVGGLLLLLPATVIVWFLVALDQSFCACGIYCLMW